MTIVSNSASPTAPMCNNDAEATSTHEDASQATCSSCRKLHDEIKTTVTQIAGKLDNLVLRVEDIYRQQQVLKSQVASSTPSACLNTENTQSTTSQISVPRTLIKSSGTSSDERRMSCTSTTSDEQPSAASSSNLVEMLSSLLGDATQHPDGTASLNGVRLEPGVTLSFNNAEQQFKIESPNTQKNILMHGSNLSTSNGSRKRKPHRSSVQRVSSEIDITNGSNEQQQQQQQLQMQQAAQTQQAAQAQQAQAQQIDSAALAMAFGINTNNVESTINQNTIEFLNCLNQQAADQPKRKLQRKSGKSSPNQQSTPKPQSNLEALVFGGKQDEVKSEPQQNATDLVAANFLSSILGSTMINQTQQQQQQHQMNADSSNYWNENVPLKTDEQLSDSQSAGSQCTNCHTTKTTAWRRDAEGKLVCNACGLYFRLHRTNRPTHMRKDVIQQRFRRKNNNSKNESSNGNSPMDAAQSFVFQASIMNDNDDHQNFSPSPVVNSTDALIKNVAAEQTDVATSLELPGNDFVKWSAYIPSSQPSTPSSTTTAEQSAELTQNLLASLISSKNLICDIGV